MMMTSSLRNGFAVVAGGAASWPRLEGCAATRYADTPSRSRDTLRPSSARRSPNNKEGAGKAGCALHPRSHVQRCDSKTHTSIQVQRKQSGLPCAMVLRLISRSSRRRIRLVTVIGGLRSCQSRSGRHRLRQLDTSNGCQNHTVLPSAATRLRPKASPGQAPFVHAPADRSQAEARPATVLARRRCRVHRIPPHVRDDRDTPLSRDGMAKIKK